MHFCYETDESSSYYYGPYQQAYSDNFIIEFMQDIMIDTKKQSPATFQRDSKNLHVTLRLTPQREVLQISVENTTILERSHQMIDHKFLSNQPDFKVIFEEPIDLFDYLTTHFGEIVVSDSAINFEFKFNGSRQRVKPLRINLMKEEVTELQMAERRFKKMKETLTNQISKLKSFQRQTMTKSVFTPYVCFNFNVWLMWKNSQVEAQRQRSNRLEKEKNEIIKREKEKIKFIMEQMRKQYEEKISQMKTALQQRKTEIRATQQKLQGLADEIIQLNIHISRLTHSIAEKDQQIKELKQPNGRIQTQISSLDQQMLQLKNINPWMVPFRMSNMSVFSHHPDSPYRPQFLQKQLSKDQVSIKCMLDSSEPARFINKYGVCSPHTISYKIELIKCYQTIDRYYQKDPKNIDKREQQCPKHDEMFVGVCTLDSIRNKYKYQDLKESGVYFSFGTGRFLQKGKPVMKSMRSNYPIIIDIDAKNIKFSQYANQHSYKKQNADLVADMPIPKDMVGKPLHFSVWMLSAGDQIKVTYK